MDFVGYGTADCGEGSTTTPAGSNTTALFRKSNGEPRHRQQRERLRRAGDAEPAPDGADRRARSARAHHRSAHERHRRAARRHDPGDVHRAGRRGRRLVHTDVRQQRSAHQRDVRRRASAAQDHYITPNVNFTAGEQCTVTILKDRVHDEDLDDSGPNTDTLPANYSWSFTVATGTAPPYPASVHLTMGNPSARRHRIRRTT